MIKATDIPKEEAPKEALNMFPGIEEVRAMALVESAIEEELDTAHGRMQYLRVKTVPGMQHVGGHVYPSVYIALFPSSSVYAEVLGFKSTDGLDHDELPPPLSYFAKLPAHENTYYYPCLGDYIADYSRARRNGTDQECVARVLECMQTIIVTGAPDLDDDDDDDDDDDYDD